jgi:hypothetical protein
MTGMKLTNPYSPSSDEYVDFEIWNNGIECFNDPKRRYSKSNHTRLPHELDYLRGFHDPNTLDVIKASLAVATGKPVKVTSFWLDKTAYVFPTTAGVSKQRRELADLAVVLHDYSQDHPQGHHAMWILQAKKSDNAACSMPSGGATKKEIELLERSPQFELEPWSKAKKNLAFDLEPEFGPPSNSANFRHWSFLLFRKTPVAPPARVPSPVQWRWNGSSLNPQTGSFMTGIRQMLLPRTCPNYKGEKLVEGNSTGWQALHDALMNHVPATTILGHARRPMRISTFPKGMPLLWWTGPLYYRFVRNLYLEFGLWPPAFKFDMISTGSRENEKLQNWKKWMSDDFDWREAERSISESIERAIRSEDLHDEPQRDGDADFVGGGRQPPGDSSGGEDGNGAHPARATLIIEIGKPRSD